MIDFDFSDFALNIQSKQKKGVVNNIKKGAANKKPNSNSNSISHSDLAAYRSMYGINKALGVLNQSMYQVTLTDVFGIGGNIPWFKNKNIGYLVTEADISFGDAESELHHAGAFQFAHLTQQTDEDMDLTFIETEDGDIFKSFRACHWLAFNADGTINEPKKYAFRLSVAILNHKKGRQKLAPVARSWLVGVKSGRTEVSSVGRSEIVKHTITFQKLMPSTIFDK